MAKIRVFILISTFIVLTVIGAVAILFARGYRFEAETGTIEPRGLLVANSDPNGAQVFINGELKTATNNTISLAPGMYDVVVRKDDFIPWEKRLTVEKEIVTQIDVFLLPSAPSLSALTFSGAFNPVTTSDLTKIAYGVPPHSVNGEKAGLWVLETTNLPLGFNRDPRQITDGDLTNATWEFSPDGREILLTTQTGVFLLAANELTPQNKRVNVASSKSTILQGWQEKRQNRLESQISNLPDELNRVFSRYSSDIRFSPDETRVLYTASASATIPDAIVSPPLPGASTQQEERDIKEGKTYVYDIKEDRNFSVGEIEEILYWLPNSINLAKPEESKIVIMDYDGTNKQSVYSGAYSFPNAYPSSSANRILVLTNLGGTDTPENLYWLSLK